MVEKPNRIILEENKPPKLEGDWTIVQILAAAEFLKHWIENQRIITQSEPEPPPPADT